MPTKDFVQCLGRSTSDSSALMVCTEIGCGNRSKERNRGDIADTPESIGGEQSNVWCLIMQQCFKEGPRRPLITELV